MPFPLVSIRRRHACRRKDRASHRQTVETAIPMRCLLTFGTALALAQQSPAPVFPSESHLVPIELRVIDGQNRQPIETNARTRMRGRYGFAIRGASSGISPISEFDPAEGKLSPEVQGRASKSQTFVRSGGHATLLSLAEQQLPNPVFEAESNLVSIPVQVIDRTTRQPITGLTRADFQLFDESSPSELVVFDDSPAPLDLLLLIDVSGGYTNQHVNSCSLAIRRSLTPADRIGLVSFSDGSPRRRAEFTNDQDLIMKGWDVVFGKDRNNGLRAPKSSRLYDAVQAGAEYVMSTRTTRRRAVVIVTHNREAKSTATQQVAMEALLESSATLEAIVLPQESSGGGFSIGGALLGQSKATPRAVTPPRFLAEFGSIEAFARESGGQTLRLDLIGAGRVLSGPTSDADWDFTEIGPLVASVMSRLRTQYTLGIRGAGAGERQFRRLTVRLADGAQTRHPSGIVRSRSGYWTVEKRTGTRR